jgi:nicotinate-nucleotide adenylyltransferase
VSGTGQPASVDQTVERIGIYGGTFDPPHIGHLMLAECAADALQLSRVLFVPAADPPHKRAKVVLASGHRVAMVHAAIADNPRFMLSEVDLNRPGPHYSADMVRLLHDRYPTAELFFLIGGDSLADFPTWHMPAEILRYALLAVIHRPNTPIDWSILTAKVPELIGHVIFIPAPEIAIASTDLRQRVHDGRTMRYQIPDTVIAYIRQNHLYEDSEA